MSAFDSSPRRFSRLACTLALLCGGAGGYVVGARGHVKPTTAKVGLASLAPQDAAVRYRFDPKVASSTGAAADNAARIAGLEVKAASPQVAAIDLTELADLYQQRGQAAGDPADFELAATTARRSLELMPSPNGSHMTLAKLANMRHDFREAIVEANLYLASGNSPNAYLTLATAYLALGELVAACDAADTAVDARPRIGSYLMRALVLEAQGRDAEAEHDYERAAAVEDFPDRDDSARLRALWGRFLTRRGEYAAAERVLAEGLRISPELPLIIAQQGELALRQGRAKDAIALFDRAFAGGREIRYLIDRARAQELAGDVKGATSTRAQVETLVRGELRDTGLGHRLDLVETLTDRGAPADLTEAIALARQEVTKRPSADTHFQLARALARSGTLPEAGTEIRRALAKGVHDARIYELAARVERKLGNGPRADLYAREAARLDPANAGWRILGLIP